jgi:hypothetical protein
VWDFIVWLTEPWLKCLFPAPDGRHRAVCSPTAVNPVDPPTLVLPRGGDELVRPYVLSAEERRARALRRESWRALCLASYGVDAGTSPVHGAEVSR